MPNQRVVVEKVSNGYLVSDQSYDDESLDSQVFVAVDENDAGAILIERLSLW